MRKDYSVKKISKLLNMGIAIFMATVLFINVDADAALKKENADSSKGHGSKSNITVSIANIDTPLDKTGEKMETDVEYDGDSSEDEITWYSLKVEDKGILSFIYVTDGENTNFYLFDKKGNPVEREDIAIDYGTLEDDDLTHIYAHSDGELFGAEITYEVKKGTYYAAVNPGWQDTGYGGKFVLVATLPEDEEVESEEAEPDSRMNKDDNMGLKKINNSEQDRQEEGSEYLYKRSDRTKIDDEIYAEIEKEFKKSNIDLPADKSLPQMVINEIYAKHGYEFKTKAIQEFFEEKSWYDPYTNDMDEVSAMLNKTEQDNIKYLKSIDK